MGAFVTEGIIGGNRLLEPKAREVEFFQLKEVLYAEIEI